MSIYATDKQGKGQGGWAVAHTPPNVGQYGWTKYEAAQYDQLIEYVNMAKDFSGVAEDSARYVEEVYRLKFEPGLRELRSIYDGVSILSSEFHEGYTDFKEKYADFILKYDRSKFVQEPIALGPGWGLFEPELSISCTRVYGVVYLSGIISGGVGSSALIATLREDFKPLTMKRVMAPCSGGYVILDIAVSGEITITSNTTTNYNPWISLDGVSFVI